MATAKRRVRSLPGLNEAESIRDSSRAESKSSDLAEILRPPTLLSVVGSSDSKKVPMRDDEWRRAMPRPAQAAPREPKKVESAPIKAEKVDAPRESVAVVPVVMPQREIETVGRQKTMGTTRKDNPTLWPPGFTPNPGGRPAGMKISSWLQQAQLMTWEELEAPPKPDEIAGRVAARRTVLEACKGNVAAMKEIADRTEGKALQTVVSVTTTKLYDLAFDPSKM